MARKILDVGTTTELESRWSARKTIDATGKAVLPGLIDAHIHTGMGLYRGVAQDMNNWLQKGCRAVFLTILRVKRLLPAPCSIFWKELRRVQPPFVTMITR